MKTRLLLLIPILLIISITPVLAVGPLLPLQNPTKNPLPAELEADKKYNNNSINGDRVHKGVDLTSNTGDPVFAAMGGTISKIGYQFDPTGNSGKGSGWGCYIIIDHGNGIRTLYAHLNETFPKSTITKTSFKEGDTVTAGQPIAESDNSGGSRGEHLHFEVRSGTGDFFHSQPFDPYPSLQYWAKMKPKITLKSLIESVNSYLSIATAHDPNIMYGPEGYVSAGQTLTYTVEFENEGQGIAYGVYITDILDGNLDDNYVSISNCKRIDFNTGTETPATFTNQYDSQTRMVSVFIDNEGEVVSKQGGKFDLNVRVKNSAGQGATVTNNATVYFPSVPEQTRTNSIVSVIPLNTLTAYLGDLDINENETPVLKAKITASNGEKLSYQTVKFCINGSSYTTKSDADGMAAVYPNPTPPPGPCQVAVIYDGDGFYYLASNDTKTLQVHAVDKASPLSELQITGFKYQVDSMTYISNFTTFTITTIDAAPSSGIKELNYAISGTTYTICGSTNSVQSTLATTFNVGGQEGKCGISYWAKDNLGNTEVANNIEVVMDTTPPQNQLAIQNSRTGPNGETFVTLKSTFVITAQDPWVVVLDTNTSIPGSGVKKAEYRLDVSSWAVYLSDLIFTVEDGMHTIYYKSYDNLNNQSEQEHFGFIIDNTAPSVVINALPSVKNVSTQTVSGSYSELYPDIFSLNGVQLLIDTNTKTFSGDLILHEGQNDIVVTAQDIVGNVGISTASIVLDTVAPLLIVPNDITAEATGIETIVNIGTATVTDMQGAIITNNAPSAYNLGTTTVTWIATDASGNTSTALQRVTVVDTTPPALSVPSDITAEATGIETVVHIGTATATDIFAVTITNNAPPSYVVGTTTVSWTATDANGNILAKTQRITVVHTSQLVLTAPTDVTAQATGVETVVAIGTATAVDVFPVTITNDAPVGFKLGINTVTWTATNTFGDVATSYQLITIIDTVLPAITINSPIGGEAFIAGISTIAIAFEVSDVDPKPVMQSVLVKASGAGTINVSNGQTINTSLLSAGSWQLVITATDWAGNISSGASGAFEVIYDTTPPVTQIGVSSSELGANFTLSATDDVSGVAQTSYRIDSGSWQVYISTVTLAPATQDIDYYSVDKAGNTEAIKNYHFNVNVDTVPPVAQFGVIHPQDQVVFNGVTYVNGRASFKLKAWDTVVNGISSGMKEMSYKIDGRSWITLTEFDKILSFDTLADGQHSVSYKAEDNAGNVSTVGVYTAVFDKTRPAVASTIPQDGGRFNPKKHAVVKITFSEPVKCTDWDASILITETRNGKLRDFEVRYDSSTNTALITGKFKNNSCYKVTVKNGITDLVNNSLAQYKFSFNTLISAKEGCTYEDEETGLIIIALPNALPCDGYFEVQLLDNVCLPRIPKPFEWLFGGKKAYLILYRNEEGEIVKEKVQKAFKLVIMLRNQWIAFAPSEQTDPASSAGKQKQVDIKNMKLYHVGSVDDAVELTIHRQGAPSLVADLSKGSIPKPQLVPLQAANDITQEVSAELNEFGMFTLAGFMAPSASLDDLSCYPSPFDPNSRPVTIQYYLINAANTEIAIYDIMGNLVKAWEITSGDTGAQGGLNQLLWDGRNGQGDIVANGGYIVCVSGDGKNKKFKFMVVK